MDSDLWLLIYRGTRSFILHNQWFPSGGYIHDKFVSDPEVPELVEHCWFILDYT